MSTGFYFFEGGKIIYYFLNFEGVKYRVSNIDVQGGGNGAITPPKFFFILPPPFKIYPYPGGAVGTPNHLGGGIYPPQTILGG